MITRPDRFLTVSFTRADDIWTSFTVEWREELDDGTNTWDRSRSEIYLIEDLPTAVKTALQTAWNGMKVHRNSITPIDS